MANYKLKYSGEKIDELLTKIDNLGTGTDTNSGTVKLSSATDSNSGVSDGVAATHSAVSKLNDDLVEFKETITVNENKLEGKTFEELPTRDTSYYGFANPITTTKLPLKMVRYYNQNWVSNATFYCRVITSDNVVLGQATATTDKADKSFSWLEFIFENPIDWRKYPIVYVEVVSRTENQCVTRITGSNTNPLLNYDTTIYRTYYKSKYDDEWCPRIWPADIGLSNYLPLEFYCLDYVLDGTKIKDKSISKDKLSFEMQSDIDFDFGLFDKVGALGDSFTYGSTGTSQGQYYSLQSSWFEQLMRRNGVRYFKNYAGGGHTTRTCVETLLPKALSEDACDCYVLAFGINDSTEYGIEYLGTINDIKDDYTQNPDTFYGNYGKIIDQLKEHSPNAKFFMFPIWYVNHRYKAEYDNAVKEISNKYSCAYFIDITKDDFFKSEIYQRWTKSHPSVISYNGMSHAIERLINKTIKENWEDFVYAIVG